MLEIRYEKLIPYPFDVVLSQYFDYEHIVHVHPQTLGEYVLVENRGSEIVYDQIWPAGLLGRRPKSRVVQTWLPPDRMTFEFIAGRHRGIVVNTRLTPQGKATLVDEAYLLPQLPNWNWLARLIRPWVLKMVERVWEEDLRVAVCIDGWPGVPDAPAKGCQAEWLARVPAGRYELGDQAQFPAPGLYDVTVAGVKLALVGAADSSYRAVAGICPHTGGPLPLGRACDGAIACPWHGAKFDISTGRSISGPTPIPLNTYDVEMADGRLTLVSAGES
jgi:nitrite reductase/ring-hydroxylating ferredoxin subunit